MARTGWALRRIAADDEDEAGILDVSDRSGIAAITNGAKQTRRGGRLAIAGAIIHVVRADDGARQFLHEVALLIGAFRRGDERQRVGSVLGLDFGEAPRHQGKGFLPSRLAKRVAFTDQRFGQPVGTVDKIPSKFSFYAGGNTVRWTFGGLHLQDVPVLGPNIEATSDTAIGADRFRSPGRATRASPIRLRRHLRSSRSLYRARCP